MATVYCLLMLAAFWQDVPFKPSAEFEAMVDLQFKARGGDTGAAFDGNGNKIQQPTGVYPFLSVNISSIQTNHGEVRLKAMDSGNKQLASKKISPNTSYRFDMGFIQDLKSGETPGTITIYFLSDKKAEINKIVLTVTREGDFMVNGEKRGQF